MTEKTAPFIKLGEDGESAPVLSYSVPESNNYVGYNIMSVDISEDFLNEKAKEQLKENLKKKNEKKPGESSPGVGNLTEGIEGVKTANTNETQELDLPDNYAVEGEVQVLEEENNTTNNLDQENVGNFIYMRQEDSLGFSSDLKVITPQPRPEKILPKILFYERMQLSNFLGNYGAGKVIKTFSLFPGEKTKISVKTYRKVSESESRNEGSSILDSTTTEAAEDFESSINSETSSKFNDYQADILNSESSSEQGEASASVNWGAGSVDASVSVSLESASAGEWGTRSARDDFSKNVSNALSKHTSRASSKRDVNINTTTTTTASTEEGEESTIEREIENINHSRTLNLVFRQMNQEFISVLHLTDVKIALYNESSGPYPKYSLYELDKFLDAYFIEDEEKRAIIKNGIIRELCYIFNYKDQPIQFIEKKSLFFPKTKSISSSEENEFTFSSKETEKLDISLPEKIEYFRVKKDQKDKVQDSEYIQVQGVILDVNKITMRTDGIVVDAFLGQGEALDKYNIELQKEATKQAKLENDKLNQAIQILDGIEEPSEKAKLYKKVFGDCCDVPQNGYCNCSNKEEDNPEAEY